MYVSFARARGIACGAALSLASHARARGNSMCVNQPICARLIAKNHRSRAARHLMHGTSLCVVGYILTA